MKKINLLFTAFALLSSQNFLTAMQIGADSSWTHPHTIIQRDYLRDACGGGDDETIGTEEIWEETYTDTTAPHSATKTFRPQSLKIKYTGHSNGQILNKNEARILWISLKREYERGT